MHYNVQVPFDLMESWFLLVRSILLTSAYKKRKFSCHVSKKFFFNQQFKQRKPQRDNNKKETQFLDFDSKRLKKKTVMFPYWNGGIVFAVSESDGPYQQAAEGS